MRCASGARVRFTVSSATSTWGIIFRVGCLTFTYVLVVRSSEMFATSAAGIHLVHGLRRGAVTFPEEKRQRALPQTGTAKQRCG